MALNPEDIQVESFATSAQIGPPIGWCCTGCDSTCGIFPTAGGCDSGGDSKDTYCPSGGARLCASDTLCPACEIPIDG